MTMRNWIELIEYVPSYVPAKRIPEADGEVLWRKYGNQVSVEFPSPKTDRNWRLTSQGWVGYIPLTEEIGFHLVPKVPVANLFRMLEYAYRLESFHILEDSAQCESLKDFYERLANILSQRIIDRSRKGLYRTYQEEADHLPYVSGRLNPRHLANRPWDVNLHCHFQEHLSDIEENQILLWTLYRITRSGMCSENVLSNIRRAFRGLQGGTSLVPFNSKDCIGRLYNRLNQDYQPMHWLCRFFLDYSGPTIEQGDNLMLPFLVNMSRLFELFVAEWLKTHLPPRYRLRAQERFNIGENGEVFFNIDLVLYDLEKDNVRCVLDTKYKYSETPSASDVQQVGFYAVAKQTTEAVLIYPTSKIQPFDEFIGESNIRVRSLAFSLEGDIELRGKEFLERLLL